MDSPGPGNQDAGCAFNKTRSGKVEMEPVR